MAMRVAGRFTALPYTLCSTNVHMYNVLMLHVDPSLCKHVTRARHGTAYIGFIGKCLIPKNSKPLI